MQDNNPIRVLHVLGTTNLGGAESRIMELYRCIDRERVQFDFLVHTDSEGFYSKEIRELGGNIYSVPRFLGKNIIEYKRALTDFFSKHNNYAAVHGHMTSTASIYLPIAKRAGIPVAIAHARSAGVDKGIKGAATRLLRLSLKNKADFRFTCSREAAEAVYGKRAVAQGLVWTIPNAIDVGRFEFNEKIRNEVRTCLKASDKLVVGHIGRFSFMKNHKYLIDIFNELCKLRSDAELVLIGDGELKDDIKSMVQNYGIADKVHFLGKRPDVERYYQAFDCFVFPSMYEGLPGSVLEAQAAGVPCIVSDAVTREAGVTDKVTYMSIDLPPREWAAEIVKTVNDEKNSIQKRCGAQNMISEKGFDVREQAAAMAEFYCTEKNPPGHRTSVDKTQIMLIVPMLYQGGHERVCAVTAKLLNEKYGVHLVIFSSKDMIYDVSGVDLINLQLEAVDGIAGKIANIIRRTRRVRKLKKELNIKLSYSFGPTANIVNVLSSHKDVVWSGIRGYGALEENGVMKLVTLLSDRIVACTQVLEGEIKKKFGAKALAVIYNPCDIKEIAQLSEEKLSGEIEAFLDRKGKTVVSMGREDDVKGFWHLIKSFYLAKQNVPDLKLMIVGAGAYTEYKELASKLGIEADICFAGVYKNPFSILRRTDIYALTSQSEGFPNALIEAMALGLACVSVNCLTGPAEILNENYEECSDRTKVYKADYGIIAPEFHGEKDLQPDNISREERIFADIISELALNEDMFSYYGRQAMKRAEDFGVEAYLKNITDLIENDI